MGGFNSPSNKADALDRSGQSGTPNSQSTAPTGVASKSALGADGPSGQESPGPSRALSRREREIYSDYIPDYLLEQLLQANGIVSNRQAGMTVEKAVGEYLKKNNLLSINTHGAAVPVSDVLAELSRQSGTPIMLDPTVPRGPRFRITLSLPACSLTEALNLILPPARLRWRTINNDIYVTPSPEFQVFYGSAPIPYITYGSNSAGQRATQNGQQVQGQNGGLGGGQNGGQGGGQAPGQNGYPK